MKLISFTVPCYNSAPYMHVCIDSLLKAGKTAEIIIIDDGSIDDTGKIADGYAEKYPDIVRVVHQENGGHGEGINQGIAHAVGKYFKVVDSDDWLDEAALGTVLDRLAELESDGGVDLMICNYVYEHENQSILDAIRYNNVFPENRVVGWDETHYFRLDQYLTLHSCIFRTQILRDSGVALPKHIFYEDNLFVYVPLPLTKRLYYMDVGLYHYLIGREGQSVSEKIMIKRCAHQIEVAERIFDAHDIDAIRAENPKLARYMYHEAMFMLAIATVFTRLNRTEKAERQCREMWDHVIASNPRMGKKMRRNAVNFSLNLPTSAGRKLSFFFYRAANKLVQFN
ncbi:MAG: glycosyltransferase family A protein [Oscillospiraceae bacterium]|nr:glycosyltransferase family A protein [Oscillospiraceae bacterium]